MDGDVESFVLPEGMVLQQGAPFTVVRVVEGVVPVLIRGFYVSGQEGRVVTAVERWGRFGAQPWFRAEDGGELTALMHMPGTVWPTPHRGE